jgi:eukaryotic-like serine/threonine-protein kinase
MEATASARSRLPQLTKYEVVEEIGHGGMATVYRAKDKRLGREVAVKVIHPHLRDSREVVARFHAEAKAVASLRHPNIVEVFDVSEPGEEEQYLVAELLRGTTLRKILQKQGSMPPEVAAALAVDLLAAIAHANTSGVVHRDVKPENVLVEHRGDVPVLAREPSLATATTVPPASGDRVVVKLTDFGIAKLLDAQGVTSTGQVLGSPAHMAPEQIEGGEVDARADVFGMGVLLYECMVGHLPFEGNNPAQVLRRVLDGQYPDAARERAIVGSRWSALLDRALAHAPADRFPDAGAMRDAILAELARLDVTSPEKELADWLDDPAAFAASHTSSAARRASRATPSPPRATTTAPSRTRPTIRSFSASSAACTEPRRARGSCAGRRSRCCSWWASAAWRSARGGSCGCAGPCRSPRHRRRWRPCRRPSSRPVPRRSPRRRRARRACTPRS